MARVAGCGWRLTEAVPNATLAPPKRAHDELGELRIVTGRETVQAHIIWNTKNPPSETSLPCAGGERGARWSAACIHPLPRAHTAGGGAHAHVIEAPVLACKRYNLGQ